MSDSQGSLSPGETAIFEQLAAILVPAADGMPSAQESGVAQRLEQALATCGDLVPDLRRALERAGRARSVEEIGAALGDDHAALFALTLIASGTYYLGAEIRRLIGYPGQEFRPSDPPGSPTYLSDGMLERVLERGPTYRTAP